MTTGDAYLFDRLGGFRGGVSLDEPLLPASSLSRNTRNTGGAARHARGAAMYVVEAEMYARRGAAHTPPATRILSRRSSVYENTTTVFGSVTLI